MTNNERIMKDMVNNICNTVVIERHKMSTNLLTKLVGVIAVEMIKAVKENPFNTYAIVSLDEGEKFTADEIDDIISMIEYYDSDTEGGINKHLTNLFGDIHLFREIEVETVKDIGMIHVTIYFN